MDRRLGLEYVFWRVWSARVEYNYMDFGTDQITRVDNTGLNLLRTADTQIQELKFGVNYHFSAAMPVVPGYR
jgi:opacity protein-like surface antigen